MTRKLRTLSPPVAVLAHAVLPGAYRFTHLYSFPASMGPRYSEPLRTRMGPQEWRALFGATTNRLPAEGCAPRVVDGVTVWVEPRQPGASRAKHRVMYRCECGATVPVGRSHQHRCKAV